MNILLDLTFKADVAWLNIDFDILDEPIGILFRKIGVSSKSGAPHRSSTPHKSGMSRRNGGSRRNKRLLQKRSFWQKWCIL